MIQLFPRIQGFSSFLNFRSILSGSGPQMVMVDTFGPVLILVGRVGHLGQDPNVSKGPKHQVPLEFSS